MHLLVEVLKEQRPEPLAVSLVLTGGASGQVGEGSGDGGGVEGRGNCR
jgi:hypothetical protein